MNLDSLPKESSELSLLLINKTENMTSFDVIRRLKKRFQHGDFGHAGTLDRFATGLLPILVHEGLKFVRFFQEPYPNLSTYWKSYTGRIELGWKTDTSDPTGTVIEKSQTTPDLTADLIESVLKKFRNSSYDQTPPLYSAKKVEGVRSSDLARRGQHVNLSASKIYIKEFVCTSFDSNALEFTVTCSKGTYIRALAQDVLSQINTIGVLTHLQRTSVGEFQLENAVSLEQFETCESLSKLKFEHPHSVLTLKEIASILPKFEIPEHEVLALRKGQLQPVLTRLSNSGLKPNAYCGWTEDHLSPVGLFEIDEEKHATYLRMLNCV